MSVNTIWHVHSALQKAINYALKIEREFLVLEGIQQTNFDMVMLVDAVGGNDLMNQHITCFKCRQKGYYRKDCPNSAGTGPVLYLSLA